MSAGIVCNAGLTAMLNASINGTAFTFNTVKISSATWNITGDETSMSSIVYTVPSADVTQVMVGYNLLRTVVYLDTTVGDFTVGTLGLYAGTTLFALAAFPGAGSKLMSILPGQAGNIRTFYVDVVLTASGA